LHEKHDEDDDDEGANHDFAGAECHSKYVDPHSGLFSTPSYRSGIAARF
jgi:hypothetical protein